MNSLLPFKNKTIVITGGSRGIGRACAVHFASLGAHVIFTFQKNKTAADETLSLLKGPGKHRHYVLNLANASSVKSFFTKVRQDGYSVDVLVNNAGVFREHKITRITFEEWQSAWEETLQTNLIGVSHLCFLVARHMMERGGGRIVNISSRGAFRGEPDHPAYGASKAGLNSLSQSLAVALAPHNIRITALAPGFVETDMAAEYLDGEKGEAVKNQSPMHRVATAQEVAHAVAMLAADGLDYMTGAIIDFNGASYLRT